MVSRLLSVLLLVLSCALSWLPGLVSACSCFEKPSVQRSLAVTDHVFRGRILRSYKDVNFLATFRVVVNRVYKGCDFSRSQRVIVTTGRDSAACGIDLKVGSTYLFSGFTYPFVAGIASQLAPKDNVTRVVNVRSCDYNAIWTTLSVASRRRLRRYGNRRCVRTTCNIDSDCRNATKPSCVEGVCVQNRTIVPLPPTPTPSPSNCTSGANCRNGTQYCDAGTCVAFPSLQCPKNDTVSCLIAPCASIAPCVNNTKCYDDYCGGCNAIFVNSTGNRVCKSPAPAPTPNSTKPVSPTPAPAPAPTKCITGADCRNGTQYCDAGTCIAFPSLQCPKNDTVACLIAPCASVAPCVNNTKCYDDYCGGCNAIFVNSTGNRVCKPPPLSPTPTPTNSTKCATGADCRNGTQYCDAGTCIAYPTVGQCPKNGTVSCLIAPCASFAPCVNNTKCYDDYCDGCNAIFVNATGNRVCKA
jgi:hypothetical protein